MKLAGNPFFPQLFPLEAPKLSEPSKREGSRPFAYAHLSEAHRLFLGEVAHERGYVRYRDAGRFHPQAIRAFQAMAEEAKKHGISLAAFSTYRGYDQQTQYFFDTGPGKQGAIRDIWKPSGKDRSLPQYLNRARISAPPGYSKHHTGLVVDLNSDSEKYWQGPIGRKTYEWLQENAGRFGYRLSYPGEANTGAIHEQWEWEYAGNPTLGYPPVNIRTFILPD